MLNTLISTGTWPPSRSDAKSPLKRNKHPYQVNINSKQDKKPRYQRAQAKITVNFASPQPSTLQPQYKEEEFNIHPDENCQEPGQLYISKWTVRCEPEKRVVFKVTCKSRATTADIETHTETNNPTPKISEVLPGSSLDSSTSPTDVFESFDTVSEISTLSRCSVCEKIEKCSTDLATCLPAQETGGYDAVSTEESSTKNLLDPGLQYEFIHGSFNNISLCESDWKLSSYGIRDLKSETSLNSLKEHLLIAHKNTNAKELSVVANHTISARKRSSELLRDILIPLNSGYVAYKDTNSKKPFHRDKVFSSLLQIDADTITMNYFNSLNYLGLKHDDVESCRASGPGLQDGIAGEKITFYVFTDKDNSKLLKVVVTGPRLVPPKSEVACLAEGFYAVTYWPDRVGWYTVNVLWRGKHISGSPFHVLMLLPKRNVWLKRS